MSTNTTPRGDSAESGKQLRLKVLPNSTPVPNWFFDNVLSLPGLRDAEKWTFLVAWRKTIGWQKTADFISISQIQKGARTRRQYAVEAGQLWENAGAFLRDRSGERGMIRYRVNPNIDGEKVVTELRRLVSGRNQFPRETSSHGEPEPVPGGTRTSSRAELTESKGSNEQTPLASDDAGMVHTPTAKTDPRFAAVKSSYVSEFEKRNPGVKAVFDGSDGKALKTLLEQQPDASAETINRWMMNAFASDEIPLRKGFRFRQFASLHAQFVDGPLRRGGSGEAKPETPWGELGLTRREYNDIRNGKYGSVAACKAARTNGA
jgi:hypothetical protein